MTSNVVRIKNGTAKIEKGVKWFFDTNIWLYLHGPFLDVHDYKVKEYSSFMRWVLERGDRIYIDQLVVAEFVNRYMRIYHKSFLPSVPEDFKRFRKTSEYSETMETLADEIYHIMKASVPVNSCFVELDISKCIQDCAHGDADFNDIMYSELCRREGFVLVTHDADCSFPDIRVATANARLATV